MELTSSENSLHIRGNIKSVEHYHLISNEIEKLLQNVNDIQIYIVDSISITSSIIGYLCKLIASSNISFSLFVKDEGLHTLLEELNLITMLNVKKYNE